MGHVQKRAEGRWRARYRDPAGRERSRTFGTQREAKAWLAETEAALGAGEWTDRRAGQLTVEHWSGEWLGTLTHLKPSTLAGYRSTLETHVLPWLGDWPIVGIDRLAVKRWVADLDGAGVGPASIRKAVTMLRGVIDTAIDGGALRSNPCARLRLPKVRSQEMYFLEPAQVEELADTIAPPYGLLVRMAAYTGMRAGELSALRVENVDLLAGRVRVVESASEAHGRWEVTSTKTHRERTVPLPKFLVRQLDEHLVGHPGGLLFRAERGGPLRHVTFYRRQFKPAVLEAPSVPDGLRFHDLRHTCAAMLIALGAHPRAVMERLGHSSVTVSLDRYGHLFPSIDESLTDGLDELHGKFSRPGRGLGTKEPQIRASENVV